MATDSAKEVVARIEAAMGEPCFGHAAGTGIFLKSDIRQMLTLLARYGGRHDWEPTWPNIDELAAPVRLHILNQHTRIEQLQRKLIRVTAEGRKAVEIIQRLQKPPR